MTEEQLWKLWDECLTPPYYYQPLTRECYKMLNDYVTGKTEHQSLRRIHGWSPTHWGNSDLVRDLVESLDGENGALAKRMLNAIVTCRSQGPIDSDVEGSFHACICAGYTVREIMDLVHDWYYRRDGWRGVSWRWNLIEKILAHYTPAQQREALNCFADVTEQHAIKNDDQQQARFTVKIALLYLIGKQDEQIKAQGQKLLQKACDLWVKRIPENTRDCFRQWGRTNMPGAVMEHRTLVNRMGFYICTLLAQQGDEKMQEVMSQLLPESDGIVSYLYNSLPENRADRLVAMEQTCRAANLPTWIYYLCIFWGDGYWQYEELQKTAAFLRKAVEENPKDIKYALQYALTRPDQGEIVNLMFVCALLCQKGDSTLVNKIEEVATDIFIHRGQQMKYFRDFLKGKAKVEEVESLPYVGRELALSSACLCEYSTFARRIIDLVLYQQEHDDGINLYQYSYINLANARALWLGIPQAQSGKLFLSWGYRLMGLMRPFFEVSIYTQLYSAAQRREELLKLAEGREQEIAEVFTRWKSLDSYNQVRLIELIYGGVQPLITDYQPLANAVMEKSAIVRKLAEKIAAAHEQEVRPILEKALPTLKGDKLGSVKRLLKRWNNERMMGDGFSLQSSEQVEKFCIEAFDNDIKKGIEWIPEDLFTGIRYADLKTTASPQVLRYIMNEYMGITETYRISTADLVAEQLCQEDLQGALENIYQLWLDTGANTKQKQMMVPYCLFASDTQILKLRRQLESWAEASRGALAAWVVPAIALNAGSVALLMVEGISNKFPNNQVKKAAKAAFSFAAQALELPEDVLADRIVPNLGFDRMGEKLLDYGSRSFKVTLMPDFSLSIYDEEKQKSVKSLPKPGANDDEVKAQAAKKEFSELKKQIKAVVHNQTLRLQRVLMNGRRWEASAWETLFVKNPIMHRFATGLVWSAYEGDTLVESFRYLEDGTFNTVEEEEYTLPENAQITLAHPVELGEEATAAWKQQLEDYEVIQPLAQLSQQIITLQESDFRDHQIIRWNEKEVAVGKVTSIAKKYDMVRTETMDAGSYSGFMMVDRYLGIYLLITAEYFYMWQGYDEKVKMDPLTFCQIGEDGLLNEDLHTAKVLDPKKLPARFVNSALAIVAQMVE